MLTMLGWLAKGSVIGVVAFFALAFTVIALLGGYVP
jgi:hypothetical protein